MSEVSIINTKCPIFITKVKDHELLKNNILNGISQTGKFGLVMNNQSVTNTDWFVPRNVPRPYLNTVFHTIEYHNHCLAKVLKTDRITTDNIWYQQYHLGDYHSWHIHPASVFSNVYYVDLDNLNPKTSFRILGEEIEVNVEEGMIITFPSFIEHCSKINESNKVKTVISFNSNFH